MNLDGIEDPGINALALLIRNVVNAELLPQLGGPAIAKLFQSPLPIGVLAQGALPALGIYRFQDRDRDKGDWVFEEFSVFRFDYVTPATPLNKVDKRWPLLRAVWTRLLAVCREGKHPDVAAGVNVLEGGGIARVALGTARVDYRFEPGQNSTYPMFRGEITFESCYPAPEAFIDSRNVDRLDDYITQNTKWNIPPGENDVDAENDLKLPQS